MQKNLLEVSPSQYANESGIMGALLFIHNSLFSLLTASCKLCRVRRFEEPGLVCCFRVAVCCALSRSAEYVRKLSPQKQHLTTVCASRGIDQSALLQDFCSHVSGIGLLRRMKAVSQYISCRRILGKRPVLLIFCQIVKSEYPYEQSSCLSS